MSYSNPASREEYRDRYRSGHACGGRVVSYHDTAPLVFRASALLVFVLTHDGRMWLAMGFEAVQLKGFYV